MGLEAATKDLNTAIDGVEQFIQQIVDTKIKKIDDYGNKITAYFDADFKLIETACYWLIHANEEQMKNIIIACKSEQRGEPLVCKAMASPRGLELGYITKRMKLTGYIKGNPNPNLFSIEKKNDTYFTPSDLVLSSSEASQIRAQINKVGTNQYRNFKQDAMVSGLDKQGIDQGVLDAEAVLSRWNKINVPESQLIQTYSLPLKQKALIWDLKIDILIARRDDVLKQANRDTKAAFVAKKLLAYSLDSLFWPEEMKQEPTELGDGLEGENSKIRELYSRINELYAQIEKLEKEKPEGRQECIKGVESPLEKAYKQINEKELQISKLYYEIRSQEHELLKGGK